MSKPSAPKPPDPKVVAGAQTGTNVTTAIANQLLNQTEQQTPYGATSYERIGQGDLNSNQQYRLDKARYKAANAGNADAREAWGERLGKLEDRFGRGGEYDAVFDPASGKTMFIPRTRQVESLTPRQERLKNIGEKTQIGLANLANSQTKRLQGTLDTPFDLEGLPELNFGEAARDEAQAALMARMRPQLDQDRERLRTQLANQGVKLGSEAYDRGMADFGRLENDATLGAIIQAGGEADRIYSQSLGARQQAVEERFARRNQPINEITALMSGSQVTMPRFGATPTASIPTTDYAGLVNANYQQQLDAWRQKVQSQSQLLGGLFGAGARVASAGLM